MDSVCFVLGRYFCDHHRPALDSVIRVELAGQFVRLAGLLKWAKESVSLELPVCEQEPHWLLSSLELVASAYHSTEATVKA